MSIYAAPNSTFEASVSNAVTGLTGTLGIRIMDGQGNTSLARHTTGIIESPAGSGIYTATLTAPATAGTYLVVWDTGGTGTLYADEDLTVTSTAPGTVQPSGSDLTTLAAVRAFLQKDTGATTQDSIIQSLITRASATIERWSGREFHPTTNAARKFSYTGGYRLEIAPYDLRTITTLQYDTNTTTPTTMVVNDDYWLGPASSVDGTYDAVNFTNLGVTDRPGAPTRREITITGDWGFASVPADVEHACIVTVAIWLRRDVAAFSTTFSLDEQRLERPEPLPSAVRGLLDQYRRIGIA